LQNDCWARGSAVHRLAENLFPRKPPVTVLLLVLLPLAARLGKVGMCDRLQKFELQQIPLEAPSIKESSIVHPDII
jgi:hypothetical protein